MRESHFQEGIDNEVTYLYVPKLIDLTMVQGHHLSCFFLKKKRRSDDHGTTEK
jgi:hypothetical protein